MSDIRLVIVVKRLDNRYQAQIRYAAGSNVEFFGRREQNTSAAKRMAERLFGPLDWQEPPAALKQSEPEVNQLAYLNLRRA